MGIALIIILILIGVALAFGATMSMIGAAIALAMIGFYALAWITAKVLETKAAQEFVEEANRDRVRMAVVIIGATVLVGLVAALLGVLAR